MALETGARDVTTRCIDDTDNEIKSNNFGPSLTALSQSVCSLSLVQSVHVNIAVAVDPASSTQQAPIFVLVPGIFAR